MFKSLIKYKALQMINISSDDVVSSFLYIGFYMIETFDV